jgi:hypothetical protein
MALLKFEVIQTTTWPPKGLRALFLSTTKRRGETPMTGINELINTGASAGERKSSYHPLVQLLLGLNGLIVPINLIFWWYGNLCFPALGSNHGMV